MRTLMLGPLDYVLWMVTALLQAAVVVCAVYKKSFLKYFPLNFYMLAASVFTGARYFFVTHYGFRSAAYFYFYYYSDLLLTICLFFALMGLFSHVFREMGAKLYLRLGSLLVLGLTCVISYVIVSNARDRLVSHFVAELSQNLYFVGAVLTYVLWAAVKKLHETRTQLIQLVLALGVYFSALAGSYAICVLYPLSPIWKIGSYTMALWLPIAWGYTFLRVPEGARISTARVAHGTPRIAHGSR
jgi:hypothetical protein